MLRQKSCSNFRSITGRQEDHLCYGRKAVPNLDPSLADRRIIYASVEKLFQIQLYQQPTEGSFMLRQKSCSKFRSITGRQKDHLCYDRKAVPNLDPSTGRQKDYLCYGRKAVPNLAVSVADRRIIYATVEKLFQIQIHHWQTGGPFMLRQKSCSKFSFISSRQKDHLCYGRKAVPNLDPSLADRRIRYATVEKLFQIQIHHWQTGGSFMLSVEKLFQIQTVSVADRRIIYATVEKLFQIQIHPLADRRIIYATIEKLFQIQIHHWQTEGLFMLRQKSCSKFRSITGRQEDHLCYDRKAVPNLDPSLADRRIIYATVEKLFQIQLHKQPTEESFMLRQKSCSKFRSITGRQKDHLCYDRKAAPNLDPSLADRRIIHATVEKLLLIQIHHWQTEELFMLRQKCCSKFTSISSRQKDHLCYDRKAVPN